MENKFTAAMSNTEIQEGNKLIAEFMGLEPFENPYRNIEKKDGYYLRTNPDKTVDVVGTLKYHSSWDWLMPVVEKIEVLGFDFLIFHDEDGQQSMIFNSGYSYKRIEEHLVVKNRLDQRETKMKSVWLTVIQFIQWYNQNKKP